MDEKVWKYIGEILRESGRISLAQVEEALAIQSRPAEKRLLGQILIARGYATPAQVKVALAKQKGIGK